MSDEHYARLANELRDHQNGGRRHECEAAADAIESLQSQLAAANERADRYKEFWEATLLDCREAGERADVKAAAHSDMAEMYRKEKERADGLQKIVEAARAQKPVAWRWLFSDGVADTDRCFRGEGPPPHIEQEVLRGAIPRTVQKLYAAPVPAQPIEGCIWCVTKGGVTVCQPPRRDERFHAPAQPAVVPEIFPGTTDALAKLSIKPEE